MNSGNDFTKHIHVKNIIRLLSILLMVFFFVPSFMVSCAGYGNIKISAFKAMTGIKIEGESVSDPKVICIIMLLLPIAMLALWCLKSVLKDKIAAIASGSCAVVDFIFWIALCVGVNKEATDNYCTAKVTAGFIFNILFILAIVALDLLIIINVLQAEKPLIRQKMMNGYQGMHSRICMEMYHHSRDSSRDSQCSHSSRDSSRASQCSHSSRDSSRASQCSSRDSSRASQYNRSSQYSHSSQYSRYAVNVVLRL